MLSRVKNLVKYKNLFLLFFVFFGYSIKAQRQVETKPKSYKSPDGKLYWNKNMPVYIRLASTPNDTGQILQNSVTKDTLAPFYFDKEGKNTIKQAGVNATWEVYADSKSPKTALDFGKSTMYLNNNTHYFGNNLKIDILAVDRMSGADKTYYSLNNEPYKEFSQEFSITNEGDYTLKYYSVDKVGNIESPRTESFSVDLQAPVSFYNILGKTSKGIFSVNTKIKFSASDSISGVSKIMYQVDDNSPKSYNGNELKVGRLKNGDHTIKFYALDNVDNAEPKKEIKFYLDKMAPILSSTILGDQYVNKGKIYFSGRSMLKITGVDDKAGLKEIKYSVDGVNFKTYNEPFYLPPVSGLHSVKYFAVDNMENKTETKRVIDAEYENLIYNEDKIYVDLVAPEIKYNFLGTTIKTRDTLFVGSNTQFRLFAHDGESGLKEIAYYFDNTQVENIYSLPFNLKKLKTGVHTIKIVSKDNVNNTSTKEFVFVLDNTPPDIKYFFNVSPYAKQDGYNVYPDYTTLYLAAIDATIGAKNITYKINEGKLKNYTGIIKGFKKNELNVVEIFASDNLGNSNSIKITFYIK